MMPRSRWVDWRWVLGCALFFLAVPVTEGAASPVEDGFIRFTVEPVKDTVLTHESTYFVVALRNEGGETLVRTPFDFDRQFVRIEITNLDTGEDVPVCGIHLEYYGDTSHARKLPPGEQLVFGTDLLWGVVCQLDSIGRVKHWWPGWHRAVFKWECDLRDWLNREEDHYVVDSLEFVVVEGTERDRLALAAFLDARRRRLDESPEASAGALWEVAQHYPESPYAGEALSHLCNEIGWQTPLPPSMTMEEFASSFVRLRPYDGNVGKYVAMAAEGLDSRERFSFLSYLADSLPGSSAGKAARELLRAEDGGTE